MLVEISFTIAVIIGLFIFLYVLKSPGVVEIKLKDALYSGSVIKFNSFISADDALLILHAINTLDETQYLTKQQELLRNQSINYLQKRGYDKTVLENKLKITPPLLNKRITLICE